MASQDYKLLSYNTVKQTLNTIPQTNHRILLKTIYAGCARVGEIVNHKTDVSRKHITPENFEVVPNFLSMHIFTEKSKAFRKVPIARKDLPRQQYFQRGESWLTEDIINHAQGTHFDVSTRWAEKIFEKYFFHKNCVQHIHWLRHWRATHLLQGAATGVPVPIHIVAKIGGWNGTSTLSRVYDASIVEDYLGVDYKL